MDSGGFVPLQAQAGGFDVAFLAMMMSIFLIFYFLVIRPQQKQQRERDAFLKTAARGDDVVTQGGIHGKVAAVDGRRARGRGRRGSGREDQAQGQPQSHRPADQGRSGRDRRPSSSGS